ncbi:MAG: hypothetical protein LH472_02360 [Pyrinomonadaceae bacterium]|nr:hypothetical protein [Pyrinomonadaceae bacterium]
MEVTLNLPKKIYLDLSKSAQQSKRTFDEVVSERLQNFPQNKSENPLAPNSDEEVLEAAKLWIPENQSARHSRLLDKNQAGTLADAERKELDFFQQVYRIALLRKAQGINEALRRGLIKSVDDLK